MVEPWVEMNHKLGFHVPSSTAVDDQSVGHLQTIWEKFDIPPNMS